MDGVLYDFDSHFKQIMPGVEMEDDSKWTWQELHAKCPGMYLDGGPMADIKKVFDFTGTLGDNFVLTAVPRRWSWPNVTKHKRDWMLANFNIPIDHIRFGPYAEDKQYHCVDHHDILIDDRIRNIEQWESRGGIGIHHTSPEQTLDEIIVITALHPYYTPEQ